MSDNDPGPIPEFLDRSKTLSKKEHAAALRKAREATERDMARTAPIMPKKDATQPTPAETSRVETRKERSRVRVEKLLAKKAGETVKVPLSGRDALAAIKAGASKEMTMQKTTTTTTAKKPPVPPPAAGRIAKAVANSGRGAVSPAPKKTDEAVAKLTKEALEKAARAKAPAAPEKPAGKAKPAGKGEKKAPAVKAATKPAKGKADAPRRTSYDWLAAKATAEAGKVPGLPPFKSYDVHLKDVFDFAKKKDAKGLREYMTKFKKDPCPPSRQNLFDYADLCLMALK